MTDKTLDLVPFEPLEDHPECKHGKPIESCYDCEAEADQANKES